MKQPAPPWCRYSIKLVRHREEPPELARQVSTSEEAARYLHRVVADCESEVCGALFLDGKAHAMGYTVPFKNRPAGSLLEPRPLLQRALLANAAALILFRHQPCQAAEPNAGDIHLARRMILAGGMVGIVVLDHLILGVPPNFVSVVHHAELQPDLAPVSSAASPEGATPYLKRLTDRRLRVQPKYRHPVTGATWSGRGNVASWLAEELAAGHLREDFLISLEEG